MLPQLPSLSGSSESGAGAGCREPLTDSSLCSEEKEGWERESSSAESLATVRRGLPPPSPGHGSLQAVTLNRQQHQISMDTY